MKKNYRLVLIVLAFLGLGLLPTAAQDAVTLSFVGWGGPEEGAVFQQLVDTFNANNSDVQIDYTQIPSDYVTALNTLIAGGTPPDIAYVPDGGPFTALVTKGQLVNLQPFVDASTTFSPDDVWPSALGRYMYDAESKSFWTGDLYALPKDIGPTVLYINVDLFEAAGVALPDPNVPMTWEQLVEIGTALTVDANGLNPGEEGFDANNIVQWGIGDLWFENVVYGNGGRIVSEDGRTFVAADDANTIEAIQFLSDLDHVYQIRPNAQQTASMSVGQMFETGRMGLTTNGRWATTGYRASLSFEWDVRPNPVGPSGQVTAYANQADCSFGGWSGSVGLSIIAGSQGEMHADLAYRFIEFLAGPDGQIEQAALGFQIPNQVEVAQTDAFLQPDQAPANAQIFLEAARCQSPGPWTQTPLYGQWFDDNWWNGVWPEVVIDGSMLAEDALANRKDAFQQRLDEAWASLNS
ncbi:MAG: sugar ABC transporter substrate-binding protein [Anaerolineae bacterium]|nr:sugar ABC transporter substrate-binding protein [Anaerolineae bacterium]